MSYVIQNWSTSNKGRVFRRPSNNLACRELDSIITKDDYYQLCALINQAYTAGVTAGEEAAQKAMREALGINDETFQ